MMYVLLVVLMGMVGYLFYIVKNDIGKRQTQSDAVLAAVGNLLKLQEQRLVSLRRNIEATSQRSGREAVRERLAKRNGTGHQS
jgi:hypothetical protein